MSEIWLDTLQLMGLGMGTVFVFLLLLIVSVRCMTAIIMRLTPATEEIDSTINFAAVAAAVHHHHNNTQSK